MQLAFPGVLSYFCDFSCFWKSAGDGMFQENPCKTLAGRTKIGVRPWTSSQKDSCQMKQSMLDLEAKQTLKMKPKILENHVRSGQLSSCQFLVVLEPLASAGVEVRGTPRHSRRSPPPQTVVLSIWSRRANGAASIKWFFFSAPLNTGAADDTGQHIQ